MTTIDGHDGRSFAQLMRDADDFKAELVRDRGN